MTGRRGAENTDHVTGVARAVATANLDPDPDLDRDQEPTTGGGEMYQHRPDTLCCNVRISWT